jgi:hypothetical protein
MITRVEIIEKLPQAKYNGEYLYTTFTLKQERTEVGRMRINKLRFKEMLGNRAGWLQGQYINKSGIEVPYVIRRVEE